MCHQLKREAFGPVLSFLGQNAEKQREQSPPPLLEHPWVPPECRDIDEVRQKIIQHWATASQGDAEPSSSSLPEVCGLQG